MTVKVNFAADNEISLVFGAGPIALYDETDNLWYPGVYWLAVKLPNTIQYGDVFRVYDEAGLATRAQALVRAEAILQDEVSQGVTDNTLAQILTGIKSITFDITNEDPPGVGQIKWNPTEGVLEFGAIGGVVKVQLYGEVGVRGRNNTGATLLDGKAGRFVGGLGNKPLFDYADNDGSWPPGGAIGRSK
jgi:hypothetical protein